MLCGAGRQNRLPAHRKEHWAYCRMVEVARRINLRPQSTQEWDEIAPEISNIQRLTPNNWYGEYLRNKVAEVRRTGRRLWANRITWSFAPRMPDEAQTQPKADAESRRLPGSSVSHDLLRPLSPSPNRPVAAPSAAARDSLETAWRIVGARAPCWLSMPAQGTDRASTANGRRLAFSAGHDDAAVTRAGNDAAAWPGRSTKLPISASSTRTLASPRRPGMPPRRCGAIQAKSLGKSGRAATVDPACDLYLYPSGKVFARETNQPENSPGFSTMMCNGNRVVARRMNLRADHPLLVTAILPHEVTHVVLADLFTTQQIPRWADEGIAVLAEPNAEQEIRAAELQEPLEAGRIFDLRKLMAMDYPDAKDWSLYYAQSVSLTRFLVERGPPEQFVQFVQSSQRDGIEGALRGTYGIASLAELQERWTAYARQRSAPVKEARRDPGSQPDADSDQMTRPECDHGQHGDTQ